MVLALVTSVQNKIHCHPGPQTPPKQGRATTASARDSRFRKAQIDIPRLDSIIQNLQSSERYIAKKKPR